MCNSSPAKTETRTDAPVEAIALSVPDMTCSHCVKAFAERLPGTAVEIDLAARTVCVVAPAELAAAILSDAGYAAARI